MKTSFHLSIKHFLLLIGVLLLSATLLISSAHSPTQAEAAQFVPFRAFVNVNVIPMDTERVLENQTVVVKGDRITAIGPVDEVTVPEAAEIIDGQGGYLMPGLADMQTNLGNDSSNLILYLANGVTTVRTFGSRPLHQQWQHQHWRLFGSWNINLPLVRHLNGTVTTD